MNKVNDYSQQLKKIVTIDMLEAFHNERFIRLAYRLILKREVDPAEFEYYFTNIRVNISPVEILKRLKASEEYQKMDASFVSKVDKCFFVPAPVLYLDSSNKKKIPTSINSVINMQQLIKKIDKEAKLRSGIEV